MFWLPASRDQEFQYWERIGTAPRAEIKVENGVCTTPATSVRARQRLGGSLLGRLARKLTGTAGEESWTLPNGQPAEKCGELKTDLLLAWPENESVALDEESFRSQWPGLTRFQTLGSRLVLVAGACPHRCRVSLRKDQRVSPGPKSWAARSHSPSSFSRRLARAETARKKPPRSSTWAS